MKACILVAGVLLPATNQRWIEIGNDTSLAQNVQKEA
jgi:hypothetical protein